MRYAEDIPDDIIAGAEAERRRKHSGWGFDERTGCYDYCPEDPQRQDDEPEESNDE